MNAKEIEARLLNGIAITDAERAFLIASNPHAMAAFMIANNPGGLNYILQQMGYTHLGFEPKKDALIRQMDLIIERNNKETFDEIRKKFIVMPEGLTPEFANAMVNQFTNQNS